MKVINKAKESCENSGININGQLVEFNKLSKRNNNAVASIQDYKLSRYICYLIVADIGGTMHKKLLPQNKSIKELEQKELKRLK